MVKAIHVFFTGKVQGVWFRATTKGFAQNLQVYGWVKNLPDGRVELFAESSDENLEALLEKLDDRFQITGKEIEICKPSGLRTFDVLK